MNNVLVKIGLVILFVAGLVWVVFRDDRGTAPAPQVQSTDSGTEASRTIIAFGDSLTAGYGVSQSETYPAQLEVALRNEGYDARVINAGVSGETTRGNLERATFIRAQNPDIVILGIGGNDALRALPIEETGKNIRLTIETLQGGTASPRILLLHMQAPLNAGIEYKRRFDALYETIADEKGLELVPFITKDIFLDANNKLPDGIHYNQFGYQKVVNQYILPRILDALGE